MSGQSSPRGADERPTQQAYGVFEDLSGRVTEQLRQLEDILTKEVSALIGQDETGPERTAARQ